MVIYSAIIKDFLDKIYFYELAHKNVLEFSLYQYYEEKLYNLAKLTRHTTSIQMCAGSMRVNFRFDLPKKFCKNRKFFSNDSIKN